MALKSRIYANNKKEAIEEAENLSNMRAEGAEISVYEVEIISN